MADEKKGYTEKNGSLSKELINSIKEDSLFMHINYLCNEIGVRSPGTRGERIAAEYIESELQEMGLGVEVEEFNYRGWIFEETSVEVLEPEHRDLKSTWFVYSPSTSPEGITAELVDCGGGSRGEISARDVKDKVVMLGRFQTTSPGRQRIVALAAEYGALACLEYNSAIPEGLAKVGDGGGHRFGPGIEMTTLLPPLPIVSISYSDAKYLMDELKKGRVVLRVKVGSSQPVQFWRTSPNVVAKVKGSKYPEEEVYLIGHLDANTPGAHDNASGVAAVLEVGKFLVRNRPKRTVALLFPGCEQFGPIGATAYVRNHWEEMEKVVGVIDYGAIGDGDALWLDRTPDLGGLFDDAIAEITFDESFPLVIQPPAIASDHAPFLWLASIPSTHLHWREFRYLFTPEDLPSNISRAGVRMVTILGALAALRLANEDVLPLDYERYASEMLEDIEGFQEEVKYDFGLLTESLGDLVRTGKKMKEVGDQIEGDELTEVTVHNQALLGAGRSLNKVMVGDFKYLPTIKQKLVDLGFVEQAIEHLRKTEGIDIRAALEELVSKSREARADVEEDLEGKTEAVGRAVAILQEHLGSLS